MKLKLAKKILSYNPNCKINWKRWEKFKKLRPPRKDTITGRIVYPSWHDIDIIKRANTRLNKWIRNKNKKKEREN